MPNSNSTFDYVMQQLSQTTLTLREIAEAAVGGVLPVGSSASQGQLVGLPFPPRVGRAFLSPISELKRTETFFRANSVNTKAQLEIDFTPGLTEQFPKFLDCVKASVYGCGRQFQLVAADLDMSSSKLSRMLADNPEDKINFPVKLLPQLVEATGDLMPIYWLIEKFVEGQDAKQRRVMQKLAEIADMLPVLLQQAGSGK